jgi:FixJ family two-component response regulator
MTKQPTVIIVDDDRESLDGLLRAVGLHVKALASVPEFVKEGRPEGSACLVLDVRLPGRMASIFSGSSRRRTFTKDQGGVSA